MSDKAAASRIWGPLSRIEDAFDALKRRLGTRDPSDAVVHPYFGHGTKEALHFRVRVLEGPAPELPHPARVGPAGDRAMAGDRAELEGLMTESRRETLARMWQRFETDEVPGAVVEVLPPRGMGHPAGAGPLAEATTGPEGHARIDLPFEAGEPDGGDPRWRQVRLRVRGSEREAAEAEGHVLVPGDDARFAIVSDIDDTIVETHATSLRKMIPLVLTRPADARTPFPGVAAFYKALEQGGMEDGGTLNPVFYVSSSPWNLYDLIVDYMAIQSIPLGPIFLRDFGLTRHGPIGEGHGEHKGRAIDTLLAAYPDLPFVLIGDSGERDPLTYAEVAARHPGRIKAVYLRAVTEKSAENARPHVETLGGLGVPVRLAPETATLAEHAASIGLIASEDVGRVRARKDEEDRG